MGVNRQFPPSYWENLVRGAVRVRHPDDAKTIGAMCAEAFERGEPLWSAWHMSASFYGHKCNCTPCRAEGKQ